MGLVLILILLIYGFLGFDGHDFVAGVSGVSRKQHLGMFFVVVVAVGGCRGYLGIGFLFLFGF